MNERIRELIDQMDREGGAGDSYMTVSYRDLEKFAELIMRECISACATDRLGKTVGAEELIKEHFGIEK